MPGKKVKREPSWVRLVRGKKSRNLTDQTDLPWVKRQSSTDSTPPWVNSVAKAKNTSLISSPISSEPNTPETPVEISKNQEILKLVCQNGYAAAPARAPVQEPAQTQVVLSAPAHIPSQPSASTPVPDSCTNVPKNERSDLNGHACKIEEVKVKDKPVEPQKPSSHEPDEFKLKESRDSEITPWGRRRTVNKPFEIKRVPSKTSINKPTQIFRPVKMEIPEKEHRFFPEQDAKSNNDFGNVIQQPKFKLSVGNGHVEAQARMDSASNNKTVESSHPNQTLSKIRIIPIRLESESGSPVTPPWENSRSTLKSVPAKFTQPENVVPEQTSSRLAKFFKTPPNFDNEPRNVDQPRFEQQRQGPPNGAVDLDVKNEAPWGQRLKPAKINIVPIKTEVEKVKDEMDQPGTPPWGKPILKPLKNQTVIVEPQEKIDGEVPETILAPWTLLLKPTVIPQPQAHESVKLNSEDIEPRLTSDPKQKDEDLDLDLRQRAAAWGQVLKPVATNIIPIKLDELGANSKNESDSPGTPPWGHLIKPTKIPIVAANGLEKENVKEQTDSPGTPPWGKQILKTFKIPPLAVQEKIDDSLPYTISTFGESCDPNFMTLKEENFEPRTTEMPTSTPPWGPRLSLKPGKIQIAPINFEQKMKEDTDKPETPPWGKPALRPIKISSLASPVGVDDQISMSNSPPTAWTSLLRTTSVTTPPDAGQGQEVMKKDPREIFVQLRPTFSKAFSKEKSKSLERDETLHSRLLAEIRAGIKLRKVQCNDRSAPFIR